MIVLGISAFYHDSAVALIIDGKVVAAAQEERFSRIKHDSGFPRRAISWILNSQGLSMRDVDVIAYYERPWLKFRRLLTIFARHAPVGFPGFLRAMRSQLSGKLFVESFIRRELGFKRQIYWSRHHASHAASAFYPSPYHRAAILTVDGVGEWDTTTFGTGDERGISLRSTIAFPDSLGMLYSAMTWLTGFKVNSGEYKLMGLAPYGEPKFVDTIRNNLIEIHDDGSYRLNMAYFDYELGQTMITPEMERLFGRSRRQPESPITQKDMDIARSVQEVLEEVIVKTGVHIRNVTGEKHLCMSGGVALNCVANGKLLRANIFDDIWVQPASGDAGGALGAALNAWIDMRGSNGWDRGGSCSPVDTYYLGPAFSDIEIREYLDAYRIPYRVPAALYDEVAALLAEENVIGWFQGAMEFGPRALGARSILGDPRSTDMQKTMNLKIKYRESFRPFAPAVMEEHVSTWFEHDRASPYMLIVADVAADKLVTPEKDVGAFGLDRLNQVRSRIPAVTHVDNSARIQTVSKSGNPKFYRLLEAFYHLTGCPVLINTSFNVRGEPIVCSPEEAYQCFMRTEMDYLVLGNVLLSKGDQPHYEVDRSWQEKYELD